MSDSTPDLGAPRVRVRLPNVLAAIARQPWAIVPDKLSAILDVVALHAAGGAPTLAHADPFAERRAALAAGPGAGAPRGGVAVIPIYGTLTQRANLMSDYSGGTSTEQLGAQLDEALANPQVSAIVLDIDSGGGSTSGIPELAAKLAAARGQKDVIAVVNTMAGSAAYWLAAQARTIVASPSAWVGSIGVFMVHTDVSAAEASAGIKHTIVSAGKFKAEGNPHEPLSDEARAALQAQVDEFYALFVADVAAGRGVKASAVANGYGEGRVLTAQQALAAGMIDRVATLDEVLVELTSGPSARSPRRARADAIPPALVASRDALLAEVAALSPLASADEAALVLSPLPLATAPQARSVPVSDPNTAAPAAVSDAALVAERQRVREIRALAEQEGVAAARVNAALDAGTSVDAFALSILGERRAAPVAMPNVSVGPERETKKPWASAGEFFAAVHQAHPQVANGTVDRRLYAAATGMNQAVGSEGGFLVPAQMSASIWDRMGGSPDALLPRTDNYTVEGESLEFVANAETSRARGSLRGGMRAYWLAEAAQITASRPKFRKVRLEPQGLAAMVYVTDKLLKNSPLALEQYVNRSAAEAIDFEVSDSIIRGSGAGMPKGLLSSGSLISVAKETNQAAASLQQENISKMWARLHPRARANAVWLINADVEPALDTLSTVVKNVAGTENVGGYANKVFDAERRTLKGRPVIVSEFCETLGTAGDIILVDPSCYATGTRGGVETAMSMHLRFDYAETAFRFLFEADGQPWLESAITPFKGSATQSSHVALATRA